MNHGLKWVEVVVEPCPFCAVWIGPHRHSVREDGTLGVLVDFQTNDEETK